MPSSRLLAAHRTLRDWMWRCADLRDRIGAKFNIHLHERSVGKLLKKLNFSSMSGRPVHPQSDLAAQEAFKKLR